MLALDRPRTDFLGSSELAAAFSFDVFKTSRELWMEKTGRLRGEHQAVNPDMQRGILLEPVVLAHVLPRRDDVATVEDLDEFHVFDEHPNLGCHPDARIRMVDWPGEGVGEVKCPRLRTFNDIRDHGLPRANVLQLMATMGITGMERGVFAVHCADAWQTLVFPMEFDPDVFDWLMTNGSKWWDEHVVRDTPPPEHFATTSEPAFPTLSGELTQDYSPEWEELLDQAMDLYEIRTREKAIKEQLDPQLVKYIEATGYRGIEHDRGKIIIITNMGRTAFDPDAFAELGPLDPALVAREVPQEQYDALAKTCRLDPRDPRLYKKTKASRYPQLYPSKEERLDG